MERYYNCGHFGKVGQFITKENNVSRIQVRVRSYADAEKAFGAARNPDAGRPVARNTRLYRRGEDYAIQLHETDVVTFHPNGKVTLNSGGWRTVTTKDRINSFSPARLFAENGLWYLGGIEDRWAKMAMFEDGMVIGENGLPTGETEASLLRKIKYIERRKAKVDKMVREYIKGFLNHIKENGLDDPGPGDCWACAFSPEERKPGEMLEPMGLDHLLQHFKEKYYVPSLLMKAIVEQGYANPGLIWRSIKNNCEQGEESRNARDALQYYFRKRKVALAEML